MRQGVVPVGPWIGSRGDCLTTRGAGCALYNTVQITNGQEETVTPTEGTGNGTGNGPRYLGSTVETITLVASSDGRDATVRGRVRWYSNGFGYISRPEKPDSTSDD